MSEEKTEQEAKKNGLGTAAIVLIGCFGVLVVGTAVLAVVAAIAIPNFVSMQYKSKRAEIPMNLRSIKTAQMAYMQEFDVFVKCAAYPATPTKTTNQWTRSASGGFHTIDFTPDGDVRGSYMVSTTATNFTVYGLSDVDGDGVYATYVATKSENPNMPITAPDIY